MDYQLLQSKQGVVGNKVKKKQKRGDNKNKFFMFSVLSHLYGRDGRDTKKADQKSLIFDFEFFTQLIEPTFIDALTASIASFITQINENQSPGKTRGFFQFFYF